MAENGAADGPIIHIGYHKTGTTWFQDCFYPAVRNRCYLPRRMARAAFLDPGALQFDAGRARATLHDAAGGAGSTKRLILCEENLTGGLHNGGLAGCLSKDLAHRLHATFPDARIIIFTRDQASIIAAAYLQYVKGGGTHGIDRYLFGQDRMSAVAPERDEAPRFRFEHFEFDRLIALYDRLFGADRVHVHAFEDFIRAPRDFACRFASDHHLQVDLDSVDFGRSNPSLSRLLLPVTRAANLFTRRAVGDKHCLLHIPGWYNVSRYLLRRVNGSRLAGTSLKPRQLLGDRRIEWIAQRFAASNQRLAQRRSG